MSLLLIDGSSILNSCFFGTVPPEYFRAKTSEEKRFVLPSIMQTKTGIFTNGVYAMCKSLKNLIERCKPQYLAVAWDVTRDTFRRELYPDYKANRAETAPELKSQFAIMQDVLRAAGIKQFMDSNIEADDFIGSLSRQFESQTPVYIYTKDQDVLQLVSDRTRVWLITNKAEDLKRIYGKPEGFVPNGAFEFTPLLVKEVYGLNPEQIIDKKALEGDSSDNIPGVRGVGEKAAVPLLQKYGTVEGIYDALEDEKHFKDVCKDLGIRSPIKALTEGRELAYLSKTLATIKICSLPVSLEELKLQIDRYSLDAKFRELEFTSLVSMPAVPQKVEIQVQGALF